LALNYVKLISELLKFLLKLEWNLKLAKNRPFTDTAAISDSIVSGIYHGMLRGQIHTNSPLEHPIITI